MKKLVCFNNGKSKNFNKSYNFQLTLRNSKLVYSTDDGFERESAPNDLVSIMPNQQRINLHLDRKRGGKIVTVIKGLKESKDSINTLARELKRACAVGGTVKASNILIQGNQMKMIHSLLREKGYNVRSIGG